MHRPPSWAQRMLDRLLPDAGAARTARDDLDQEFEERVQASRASTLWYGWEAVKLTAHFGWLGTKRALRGGDGMMGWIRQVGFALRHLRRAPSFTATAVATIGLGIGATVTIYSILDAVVLDPLPYDRPDELVAVWEWNVPRDRPRNVANPGNFAAWRDRSSTFASLTAVSMTQPTTLTDGGNAEEVMVQVALPDFFSVLGVEAAEGRTFATEGSAEMEVVLSHRFWNERFGGDGEVVGRTLELNGRTGTVVGVLAPDFVVFGEDTDVWRSLQGPLGDQTNSGRWMMVLGRLSQGATPEAADQELKAIAVGLAEEFPTFNGGWSVHVLPLVDDVVGDVRSTLWMFLAAVGLLLFIASANVASLFLVRATTRRREMALRTALGASRGSLARQMLVEGGLVAAFGALVGIACAQVATTWVARALPAAFSLPRVETVSLDGGVLLFASALTAGTALLFGVLPSLQASSVNPARTLRSEGRASSRGTVRLRSGLVVVEVALSVVLVAGAGLFARSFSALLAVDDGIEPEEVLVGRVNLAGQAYRGDTAKISFFEELYDSLAAAPGVESVGGVTFLPMNGLGAGTSYRPADRPPPDESERRAADIRNVSGDYFDAMGIELIRGRSFDERDVADAPQTVIVNRALADRYWGAEEAIGQSVIVSWIDDTPWEVVGVVEDVRIVGPAEDARETIYIHYEYATFFPWQHVTLRARSDPGALAQRLRSSVAQLDPGIPVSQVQVMQGVVDRAVAQPRMQRTLMVAFALLATLLATVGLYGVLAYAVSQRVREIGVRIALGAQPEGVVRLVVAQGARLAGLGLLLGLAGAWMGGRFVAGLLHQVRPGDPVALAGAALVLGLVAVTACAAPALRALRVAPVEALRPD
ncbi:MAG: ABC transporter permease [Gemmatimonadota bacterium]